MRIITIYGIPNCDTVKKTLDWFKQKNIPIIFYDYKKEGISKAKLTAWCKLTGWQILLNKKSTTWRGLSAEDQEKVTTQTDAIQLMMSNTSIIKRPVIEIGEEILVGFKEAEIAQAFLNK